MNIPSRILIVDDTPEIHNDFKKILKSTRNSSKTDQLLQFESVLFDDGEQTPSGGLPLIEYRIDSAFQGIQAIKMVDEAFANNDPYALIFMDVRMPPGLNGIETMERIWNKHPFIEMIIVTAYSDYSWEQILERVGTTDRLMFLRKPFDHVSVKQMTLSLTRKHALTLKVRDHIEKIQHEIESRNRQLENMLAELRIMGAPS